MLPYTSRIAEEASFFSYFPFTFFQLPYLEHDLMITSLVRLNLKLVTAIFYQIFFFPPNDSPSKTMKSVFYFIKKAFSVLEIFKLL